MLVGGNFWEFRFWFLHFCDFGIFRQNFIPFSAYISINIIFPINSVGHLTIWQILPQTHNLKSHKNGIIYLLFLFSSAWEIFWHAAAVEGRRPEYYWLNAVNVLCTSQRFSVKYNLKMAATDSSNRVIQKLCPLFPRVLVASLAQLTIFPISYFL